MKPFDGQPLFGSLCELARIVGNLQVRPFRRSSSLGHRHKMLTGAVMHRSADEKRTVRRRKSPALEVWMHGLKTGWSRPGVPWRQFAWHSRSDRAGIVQV